MASNEPLVREGLVVVARGVVHHLGHQHPQLAADGLAAAFRYAANALKGEHTWELMITA